MAQITRKSRFNEKLLRPAKSGGDSPWAFVLLPKTISDTLPRRGRTTVKGAINGLDFQATLEPDGQLSHWLPISRELLEAAGAEIGELAEFEISPVEQEPDPQIPPDLGEALAASPEARAVWDATTSIARLDWIHWITSAKQAKTRAKRISNACDMLASGKKRVCCFDPSGYYSKAFRAPEAVEPVE